MEQPVLSYPDGHAQRVILTAAGATQEVTIENRLVIIDAYTNAASANRTINLVIPDGITDGAEIVVSSKTVGTETTVFGTGFVGVTITGTAGNTKNQTFIYDSGKSAYVPKGALVIIATS